MFFLKILLWTRRLQFCQSCRKFSRKVPQIFLSKSENKNKNTILPEYIFFPQNVRRKSENNYKIFPHCSSGYVECSFLKYVRNLKNLNSFNISKGGKFAVEFFKCLFSTNIKVLQKYRKFLHFAKIEMFKFFSKRFPVILLRGIFNKVGWRKISRLVAGCLVSSALHAKIFWLILTKWNEFVLRLG